jgi:hypothetical protein
MATADLAASEAQAIAADTVTVVHDAAGRPLTKRNEPRRGKVTRSSYPNLAEVRARCTCTGGDSIFDAATRVEGLSFEAAKPRLAEILGSTDLIREAGDGQAIQATHLPRLPPEQRADDLPLAYLAHRLGVAVEGVPRSSTSAAAFNGLAPSDAPRQGSRPRPKPRARSPPNRPEPRRS